MYTVGKADRVRTMQEMKEERGYLTPGSISYWRERATLSERRIEDLEAEVASRYTSHQVGDLQASEAELVSAPLRARIEELEQSLVVRDQMLEDATTHLKRVGDLVLFWNVEESLGHIDPEDGTPASHMANLVREIRSIFGVSAEPHGSTGQGGSEV